MSARACAIGYSTEKTFQHAMVALRDAGLDLDVIDLSRLREAQQVSYSVSNDDLQINLDGDTFSLGSYPSFYQRCYYAEIGNPARQAILSDLTTAINAYLAVTDACVVNRPFPRESNNAKLFHLAELQACGFEVPATHLLSDPALAQRLILPDGQWVSKGCSGVRSEVAVLDRAMYGRFGLLAQTPSIFQQKIPGANVRVHAVPHASVAVQIDCFSVDYRYPDDDDSVEFKRIEVPPPIAVAMQQYLGISGLMFAGFDFKVHERTGVWCVLEANPMPGYDYYDRRCDGAISQMLASLLAAPPDPLASSSDAESEPFIARERRHTLAMP